VSASPQIAQLERQLARARTDAALAAKATPGTLVEEIVFDATGRRISRFHGDPEVCWGPFKQPGRRITGFRTVFK
jgi:hypothetical protein